MSISEIIGRLDAALEDKGAPQGWRKAAAPAPSPVDRLAAVVRYGSKLSARKRNALPQGARDAMAAAARCVAAHEFHGLGETAASLSAAMEAASVEGDHA